MRKYFIFACILVTAVVSIRLGISYFSGAGNDNLTDIREVGADPQAYASQVLTSSVIMVDSNHFRHKVGTRNWHLALKTPSDLDANAKVKRIHQTYGKGKSVIIEYEMYGQTTLAQIIAYQEAEEQVRRRSKRTMSLEKEQGRLDKPVRKLEAIEKLRLQAKARLQRLTEEKEQLAKELAQLRASEDRKLERTSEIEVKLQGLTEERAQLVKERARLLASEEEDGLQRASEIKAKLQQLTQEKKELAQEKDDLQPEIKMEAELQRLANEGARLRRLAKDREGREQFNRDKARLAEEQARSLGVAASRVRIVPPRTPFPTYSRRRRILTSRSSSYVGGPTPSQLAQERRAREEREQYAAQKKTQKKLLAQQKKNKPA